MSRTSPISIYASATDRQRLRDEADDRDMSLSGYIMWIVEQHWQERDVEAEADRANVEERVEQMVSAARDDLTKIAENVEQRNDALADMVARSGTYSVATWELLKRDVPDGTRQDALAAGSRRLRDDDVLDPDVDENGSDAEGIGARFLRERRENDDTE